MNRFWLWNREKEKYHNLGTIEFESDPKGNFWVSMEMNNRISIRYGEQQRWHKASNRSDHEQIRGLGRELSLKQEDILKLKDMRY